MCSGPKTPVIFFRVMATIGPQMFTGVKMSIYRKWEMGLGLIITIDVVNLPLTLFG